jgi:hypothetical protein
MEGSRPGKHAITYRAAVVLNAVIAWTRQLSDTPQPVRQNAARWLVLCACRLRAASQMTSG